MKALLELLSDESKWIQEDFAEDANGCAVDYTSPNACRFCLSGAARAAGVSEALLAAAVSKLFPDRTGIYPGDAEVIQTFNDDSATTFSDVQKVIHEAATLME